VKGSSRKTLQQKECGEKRNWKRLMKRNEPIRKKKSFGRKEETFLARRSTSMSTETDSAMGFLGCSSALCLLLSKFFFSVLLLSYVKKGHVMHKIYIESERERKDTKRLFGCFSLFL